MPIVLSLHQQSIPISVSNFHRPIHSMKDAKADICMHIHACIYEAVFGENAGIAIYPGKKPLLVLFNCDQINMLQTDLASEISPLRASKRRNTDSHGSGRFRTLMPDSQLLLDLVECLRDGF
jgi:hypothetical protein